MLFFAAVLCATMSLAGALGPDAVFTPPFSRALSVQSPLMRGKDVVLLQQLLARFSDPPSPVTDLSAFTNATESWVAKFQAALGGTPDPVGVAGASTTAAVLARLNRDYYSPSFGPGHPLPSGFKYAVLVPVLANRSVETMASLLDADGNVNFTFRVRAHGHDFPAGSGQQLNQFGSSGATPTGLSMFDLNSPESNPKLYGPYPVNRATVGLEGNAALLLPTMRNGILMHTGEWPGWQPGDPFPNSAGCIHAAPASIERVWKTLVDWGVKVMPNTNGVLPYPYNAQGLLAVYEVDSL
jgi:hypothetical protein